MSATTPKWFFNDVWSVGTDAYNWTLLYRTPGKKNWAAKGYYNTPEQLLHGLYRKLTRMEQQDDDLLRHLERCCEAVESLTARLSEQLEQWVWKDLTRPPAHRRQKA